jgi:TetR/AcrR family transcriptional repressor of bet genes
MARPSNTAQRKEEIVLALLKVMSEKGYEKASIQMIGKAAGLTPGLIHYHFKTKQDILLALVDWISQAATNRLNTLNEGLTEPWDKLAAFINARLATGEDAMPEIVSAWVVIAGESVRQPEIKVLYQNLIDQQLKELKKLIADVWEGKTARNKEVINLAAVVLAAMEGAFQLSATANEVMPKNYAAETILGLIATATREPE